MSELTFKECVEKVNEKEDLKALFDLWKKAHAAEVRQMVDKLGDQDISKEQFETEIYKKKGNTISSHFTQFFEKKCDECNKTKEPLKKVWKIVLRKAFNMDGTYENFGVNEGGYRYICLLKEANDSKKMCIHDYLVESNIVNEWIIEDSKETCGRKYSSDMLDKLNTAFAIYCNENKENVDFKNEMAFMNVNKRGGTSTTAGRDETAVINYAKVYRDFIFKEIKILTKQCEAKVFVCGSRSYFIRLMNALDINEVKKNEKEEILYYKKGNVKFINIPHPSNWRVSAEEISEQMKRA